MEEYHKIGAELEPKKRAMYFNLGARVCASRRVSRRDFNDNNGHDLALIALEATNWKSIKAARAMLTVMRAW